MSYKIGILGGGLQGVEAASLARRAGWFSVLADRRPAPPAAGLADRFQAGGLASLKDMDRVFGGCDMVLPACENPETLALLDEWARRGAAPVAFDPPAWLLSRDKAASKELFRRLLVPTPRDYPAAPFPLIAKPRTSSGSRGVRRLDDQADLDRFLPGLDAGAWTLEEYCPGPSYSLEVTGRPGAYVAWSVVQLAMDGAWDCRQAVYPADLGPAEEEEFRALSLRLAEGLGLTGLMDVEAILTPAGFRVLEIDARLPSQTPSAVHWGTGENLLARLAGIFGGPPAPNPDRKPRAAIYEQVAVSAGLLAPVGEGRLGRAGPLRFEENFFGADLALTELSVREAEWAAVLIVSGASLEEAWERRRETLARLAAAAGRPLSPLFLARP